MIKWFVFICSYRSSMIATLWDERGRVNSRESGLNKMAEGKKAQNNFWGFPVFYPKPQQQNGKYVIICNDLRPKLNPSLSHLASVTLEISLTRVIYWTSCRWNLYFIWEWSVERSVGVVHEPGPYCGSVDQVSVFSGYPGKLIMRASRMWGK